MIVKFSKGWWYSSRILLCPHFFKSETLLGMQLVDSFMDYPLLLCKGQLFMMNSTNFQNCFLPNSVQSEGIRRSLGHTKLYLIYKCTIFVLRVPVGLFMPFSDIITVWDSSFLNLFPVLSFITGTPLNHSLKCYCYPFMSHPCLSLTATSSDKWRPSRRYP